MQSVECNSKPSERLGVPGLELPRALAWRVGAGMARRTVRGGAGRGQPVRVRGHDGWRGRVGTATGEGEPWPPSAGAYTPWSAAAECGY